MYHLETTCKKGRNCPIIEAIVTVVDPPKGYYSDAGAHVCFHLSKQCTARIADVNKNAADIDFVEICFPQKSDWHYRVSKNEDLSSVFNFTASSVHPGPCNGMRVAQYLHKLHLGLIRVSEANCKSICIQYLNESNNMCSISTYCSICTEEESWHVQQINVAHASVVSTKAG